MSWNVLRVDLVRSGASFIKCFQQEQSSRSALSPELKKQKPEPIRFSLKFSMNWCCVCVSVNVHLIGSGWLTAAPEGEQQLHTPREQRDTEKIKGSRNGETELGLGPKCMTR